MVILISYMSSRQHKIHPLKTLANITGEECSQERMRIPDNGRKAKTRSR
jgi:hypothetical protein